jgi:uroporphyrinogen-III synthase
MTRAPRTDPRKTRTAPASGVSACALAGRVVVITRPAGTGTRLAQKVVALGGRALLLPGSSLRGAADAEAARRQWHQAQRDDALLFTSPAAVRFAFALAALAPAHGMVIAVGQGTARALQRHGLDAQVPAARQDSEGVLSLPALRQPRGRRIALITAPGGRGLLQQQLAERGAWLRQVHVYRRTTARLTARHAQAVAQLPASACVLFSSVEALQNLGRQLPAAAWRRLCQATAVVSSERIEAAARAAGFTRIKRARSALQADLLAAACELRSRR